MFDKEKKKKNPNFVHRQTLRIAGNRDAPRTFSRGNDKIIFTVKYDSISLEKPVDKVIKLHFGAIPGERVGGGGVNTVYTRTFVWYFSTFSRVIIIPITLFIQVVEL